MTSHCYISHPVVTQIIEEAPAPGLSDSFHEEIGRAAVRTAVAVNYVNAGATSM